MDEEVYEIACDVCETTCEVITPNDFETPAFCPFCSAPVEVEDV
jgi:rubrerythrin